MSLAEVGRPVIAALLTGALGWAAVSDIQRRKIPNATVLIVIGLFVPWTALNGFSDLGGALLAALISFVVSFALYNLKVLGAGDSKLFAAAALFTGLARLPHLMVATGLVGGLIALVSLVTRPRRAMVMLSMRGKGDFGDGIPYGVAISAACAAVVWAGLYAPNLLNIP